MSFRLKSALLILTISLVVAGSAASQDSVPVAVQEEAARVVLFQQAMAEGRVFSSDGTMAAPTGLVPMIVYTPAKKAEGHSIVSGDTLFSLSRRYGVTVEALQRENNLSGNALNVGQMLRLPLKDSVLSTRTHTVAAKETLWSIAQSNCIGVDALMEANNTVPVGGLQPGQTLRLPPATCENSSE